MKIKVLTSVEAAILNILLTAFKFLKASMIDRLINGTGEISKIDTKFRRKGVLIYTILDLDVDRVKGRFCKPELQPLIIDTSTEYGVEKNTKVMLTKKVKI